MSASRHTVNERECFLNAAGLGEIKRLFILKRKHFFDALGMFFSGKVCGRKKISCN